MKFRRIDSKTVNCIITPEDMRVHGLKIDDIFEKKAEAMEFLHMVVGEAERRVNFRPQGAVTSMQMSVLPDHSISLTISEQSEARFGEFLKELQAKLGISLPEALQKELESLPDDERVERLRDYAASMAQGNSTEAAVSNEPSDEKHDSAADASAAVLRALTGAGSSEAAGSSADAGSPQAGSGCQADDAYMYRFGSLHDAADCCRRLSAEKIVRRTNLRAELYQQDHQYFLVVNNPREDELEFSRLALILNEFGQMVTSRNDVIAHFREQVPCILNQNTITALAQL